MVDGTGVQAAFRLHAGVVWDGASLIVADSGNHRVRRVVPDLSPAEVAVTTLAGDGRALVADGSGAAASFGLPAGLAIGLDGSIYVADAVPGAIRRLGRAR
jgi:DNA-binding beta-propeller fold protein YncE